MDFSPDGIFFLSTAGEYKNEKKINVFCSYAFCVKDVSKPVLAFPSEDPVIMTKFCPVIFKMPKNSFSLFDTNTKVVFAIATQSSISIYASDSISPIYYIKNIHYASLTDLCFVKAQHLIISSMDGYLSFLEFKQG